MKSKCPKCMYRDLLSNACNIRLPINNDGCVNPTSFDDNTYCECRKCLFVGTVKDFNCDNNTEDLLAALELITYHAFDEDTPLEDIKADFENMRTIATQAIAIHEIAKAMDT